MDALFILICPWDMSLGHYFDQSARVPGTRFQPISACPWDTFSTNQRLSLGHVPGTFRYITETSPLDQSFSKMSLSSSVRNEMISDWSQEQRENQPKTVVHSCTDIPQEVLDELFDDWGEEKNGTCPRDISLYSRALIACSVIQ